MVRIRSAPGQRSLLTEFAICTRCGRILTDPVSVARCLGRACARREAEEREAHEETLPIGTRERTIIA